jgi:hypothetical protein
MIRIGSIVIHCYEFDRMGAFWREALHMFHVRLQAVVGLFFVILNAVARIYHFKLAIVATGEEVGYTWTFIPTAKMKKFGVC